MDDKRNKIVGGDSTDSVAGVFHQLLLLFLLQE